MEKLAPVLIPFLQDRGIAPEADAFLQSVIKTLTARSKTLVEMADKALFYYQDEINYDEKAALKFFKPTAIHPMQELITQLEALDRFTETELETAFTAVMEKTGLKLGKIAQPVRLALTGQTASPGIFEIIEILGKERVIKRLKKAIGFIKDLDRPS